MKIQRSPRRNYAKGMAVEHFAPCAAIEMEAPAANQTHADGDNGKRRNKARSPLTSTLTYPFSVVNTAIISPVDGSGVDQPIPPNKVNEQAPDCSPFFFVVAVVYWYSVVDAVLFRTSYWRIP